MLNPEFISIEMFWFCSGSAHSHSKGLPMATAQAPAKYITIEELVEPFGWIVKCPDMTDVETRSLHMFLQFMHEVLNDVPGIGFDLIPKAFWMCVEMPGRVLTADGFARLIDAKALAAALCTTCQHLAEWRRIAQDGDLDAFPSLVFDLPLSANQAASTPAGDVFASADRETGELAIWFGRKAGRAPALADDRAWSAIQKLFNLQGEDPKPESKAARSESKKQERESKKQKPESKPAAKVGGYCSELRYLPLRVIQPAKENHRKTFDKGQLQELAESLKAHGVLQPLLVRESGTNQYTIIAGERRYRAAQLAGLTEVPAQIVEKSGVSESLAMLEENIRRVDLNPIERAQAIKRLMDEHQLSQKEVGQMVGVQQGQISNELRLLNLPESLQKLVASGAIAPTLIRTVLPVADLPAVVQEIAHGINEALKAERPIEAMFLEATMRNAVMKHTRPMRYENNRSAYSAPNPKDRHFSKTTPEQLKALDVREFKFLHSWEGTQRAVNLQLFDELNKAPLAHRMKKHKEEKAKRHSASEPKAKKGSDPFVSEWQARREIEAGLSELLASALEQSRDKEAVRRVALAVSLLSEGAIAEDMIERKHWSPEGMAKPLLEKLSVSPAALEQLLRKTVVNYLRAENGGRLSIEDMHVFGTALGVDLVTLWKPSEDFVKTLSDHGRQLLAETLPGQLPAFLRPLFGLKDEKPAKTKKGKAA